MQTQQKTGSIQIVAILTMIVALASIADAWKGMPTPPLHVDGRNLKDPSGKTVVLHGFMQPTSSWFNGRFYHDPTTFTPADCAEALNVYKSVITLLTETDPLFGYDHGWYNSFVRIWPPSDGWNNDGTVDEALQDRAWYNMYIPYVEHCRQRGIYVVFVGNAPDGGTFMGAQHKSNMIAYWTRICNEYPEIKNADNVMFEICNEPVDIESQLNNGDWGSATDAHDRAMRDYMQDIVDAIRATGFTNIIWVPGLVWQDKLSTYAKYPVSGPNIGYAGHMYPFGANDVDDINNRFINSGWKACSDLYPVIVTEGSWHTLDADQGLRTGTTEVFGVTVKNFYETQGNINWFCGMTEELIGGMSGGISSFTYPEINSGRAGFEWWPEYTWAAPTDRPRGLTATALSADQINLHWIPVPEAINYTIKRSTVSGGPYTILASDITTSSFSDTDLTPGETYYYVTSATMSHGPSPNSNEATVMDMRAHLKFDETIGTTAVDATGNAWNGTLVNGPVWAAGKFGNGVDLDGTDDHVTLPTGVVDGLADVTISTWVYLNSASNWSRVFDFGTGSSVNMFLTPIAGGTNAVRFAITTSGAGGEQKIDGTEALPLGEWAHVAVTISGTAGRLYVNGESVGSNNSMTLTPDSMGATTQNYIGRSQYPDPYLDGTVDDFRIYPVALTQDELETLYKTEYPGGIPVTPADVTATTASISRIDVTWTASAEATNYNIKRSDTSSGPYTMIATAGGTSFSDTGLNEGETYYYVVSALNSAGQSSDSTEAEETTQSIPPAAPTGLTATAGNNSVTLTWNTNTEYDLDGYNVYRSDTSGSGYVLLNGSPLSSPEYTDNTADNFALYFYVVTAVDSDPLESPHSNEVEAIPNDGTLVQLSGADFESGFGDWVNNSGDDTHNWTRDSAGTVTPNTGPSAGADGSMWYVYLETSPGGASFAGNTAILQGPVIGGFDRVLTFDYHMYGAEIGTLSVDVYDGTWNNDVWTLTGQQQTSSTNAYAKATVGLTGFTGPIQIRFRATAGGGTTGDMAIDNISLIGRIVYGDMDVDNVVNTNDLPEFISNWLSDNAALDLNNDGVIGLYEFSKFAANWMDSSYQ